MVKLQRSIDWFVKKSSGCYKGSDVKRNLLLNGVSIDTRTIAEGNAYIPLLGQKYDGHDFVHEALEKGAAAVFWQEDKPMPKNYLEVPFVVVDDTLKALHRLAYFYRQELKAKVIAITGSNGKTTTKDLVAEVLAVKYKVFKTKSNNNNHIGVPLTILSCSEDVDFLVLELGMNHALEITTLAKIAVPDIGVITNIGEAHLQFFGSREGIACAKLELKEGLKEEGILLFDGDEPLLLNNPLLATSSTSLSLGFGENNHYRVFLVEEKGFEGSLFKVNKMGDFTFSLNLLGLHNIKNSLFAICIGDIFGLAPAEIATGLRNLTNVKERLEIVTALNGMKILNDTYNSNPTSVKAALLFLNQERFKNYEKWVFLGDMLELGTDAIAYHKEIGKLLSSNKNITRIYTIGKLAFFISKKVKEVCKDRFVFHFNSLEEAEKMLKNESKKDVLLLLKGSRAIGLDKLVLSLCKGQGNG